MWKQLPSGKLINLSQAREIFIEERQNEEEFPCRWKVMVKFSTFVSYILDGFDDENKAISHLEVLLGRLNVGDKW